MNSDFKSAGWDWITGFYARPAVRSACLVLQDRNGADVTFLLFLCWLDASKVRLTDHYLTVNENFKGRRGKIRRTRALRRFLSTFALTEKVSKALLETEILQEKEMFLALCDFETVKTRETPVLASQYIAYKGALLTPAGKMILKQLGL